MAVAGIQETKWFGMDVRPTDGYTFLHSGKLLLSDGEKAAKDEGVQNHSEIPQQHERKLSVPM